jgi:transcription initiation factor TFIID subunit 2
VQPKPTRVVKSGGPPTKKPSLTLNPLTKLKLPASPAPDVVPPKAVPTPVTAAAKKAVNFATPNVPTKVKVSKASKPLGTKNGAKPTFVPKPHVPKPQSGGMSLNDLRASRNALKKLQSNKHCRIFLQPVDPIRDHAPKYVSTPPCLNFIHLRYSYFDIIKDPMDLCTMGAKLEDGMYKDRFAFQEDFRLMISNAKRYNVPGSFAHNEAIALETFFEKRLYLFFPPDCNLT